LGPLLSLACVKDIWSSTESTIRLVADGCIIYMKIMNDSDREKLQINLDRLGLGDRKCDENKSR